MSEPAAGAPAPTIEVVALRVAEELMTDLYQRIAELEARLEAARREADEAHRAAAALDSEGSGFVELAQQLLERAEHLRERAGAPPKASGEGARSGDALVLHLPTASQDPARDGHG